MTHCEGYSSSNEKVQEPLEQSDIQDLDSATEQTPRSFMEEFGHAEIIGHGGKRSTVAEAVKDCSGLSDLSEAALRTVITAVIASQNAETDQKTEDKQPDPSKASLDKSDTKHPKAATKAAERERLPRPEFPAATSEKKSTQQPARAEDSDALTPAVSEVSEEAGWDVEVESQAAQPSKTATGEKSSSRAAVDKEDSQILPLAPLDHHEQASYDTTVEYGTEDVVLHETPDERNVAGYEEDVAYIAADEGQHSEHYVGETAPSSLSEELVVEISTEPEVSSRENFSVHGEKEPIDADKELGSFPAPEVDNEPTGEYSADTVEPDILQQVLNEQGVDMAAASEERAVFLLDYEGFVIEYEDLDDEEVASRDVSAEAIEIFMELRERAEIGARNGTEIGHVDTVSTTEEDSNPDTLVLDTEPITLAELFKFDPEESVSTLEDIESVVNGEVSAEESMHKLALLMLYRSESESLKPVLEAIDTLGRLLCKDVAMDKSERKTITVSPEVIDQLLRIFRELGYPNPKETLMEFINRHGLQFTLQTAYYLTQLKQVSSKKEVTGNLSLPLLSRTTTDDNHHLGSYIGSTILAFINQGRQSQKFISSTAS